MLKRIESSVRGGCGGRAYVFEDCDEDEFSFFEISFRLFMSLNGMEKTEFK